MAVNVYVPVPADIGGVSDWASSEHATPRDPTDTGPSINSISLSTNTVSGSQFLEGKKIEVEHAPDFDDAPDYGSFHGQVGEVQREGISTELSALGDLNWLNQNDIKIPRMLAGGFVAGFDYVEQALGKRQVSNKYTDGTSENMLYASLRGHQAIFDVATGKEYFPVDQTQAGYDGSIMGMRSSGAQGFHTAYTRASKSARWSDRWVIGTIDLRERNRTYVAKCIVKDANQQIRITSLLSKSRRVSMTYVPSTRVATITFEKYETTTVTATASAVMPENLFGNPYTLAIAFSYSSAGIFTARFAMVNDKGDNTINLTETITGISAPRIWAGSNVLPIRTLDNLSVQSAVYDNVPASWPDWWRITPIARTFDLDFVPETDIAYDAQGYEGSAWTYLNQLLSFAGYEMLGDGTIRLQGSREIEIENTSVVSYSTAGDHIGGFDVEYYGRDEYQPSEGISSELMRVDNVGTVDAGEQTSISISGDFWASYVYQPLARANYYNLGQVSGYVVRDTDGQFVTPAKWVENGGSVSVSLGEAEGELLVNITAPPFGITDIGAPYTIESMSIWGSGFRTYADTTRFTFSDEWKNFQTISGVCATTRTAAVKTAAKVAPLVLRGERISFGMRPSEDTTFGITPGSIFRLENAYYRVEDSVLTNFGIEIQAIPYTRYRDSAATWGPTTMATFQTYWNGYTHSDFRKEPLRWQ